MMAVIARRRAATKYCGPQQAQAEAGDRPPVPPVAERSHAGAKLGVNLANRGKIFHGSSQWLAPVYRDPRVLGNPCARAVGKSRRGPRPTDSATFRGAKSGERATTPEL